MACGGLACDAGCERRVRNVEALEKSGLGFAFLEAENVTFFLKTGGMQQTERTHDSQGTDCKDEHTSSLPKHSQSAVECKKLSLAGTMSSYESLWPDQQALKQRPAYATELQPTANMNA